MVANSSISLFMLIPLLSARLRSRACFASGTRIVKVLMGVPLPVPTESRSEAPGSGVPGAEIADLIGCNHRRASGDRQFRRISGTRISRVSGTGNETPKRRRPIDWGLRSLSPKLRNQKARPHTQAPHHMGGVHRWYNRARWFSAARASGLSKLRTTFVGPSYLVAIFPS